MEIVGRKASGQRRQLTPGRRPVQVERWNLDFLAQADQLLQRFLAQDISESTRRTYTPHVKQFKAFCHRMERKPQPDPDMVAMWVMGRALHGYKTSYIELGVHAVARWSMEESGSAGLWDHAVVRRAVQAAARVAGTRQDPKLPIMADLLAGMVRKMLRDDVASGFHVARDAAMLLVAWCGMFRSAELREMRWEHLVISREGVRVYVPTSKTDQGGQGAWVFMADAGGVINPVRALKRLHAAMEHPQTGHVFAAAQHKPNTPLSTTTMNVRLRAALRRAGINEGALHLFGMHSLRRGGATDAAAAGVPVRLIMLQGRWKSDCVRRYLYALPQQRFAWVVKMLERVGARSRRS